MRDFILIHTTPLHNLALIRTHIVTVTLKDLNTTHETLNIFTGFSQLQGGFHEIKLQTLQILDHMM